MADGQAVPERVKGYLTITIAEASGRNRDDEEVWDPAFVEGYVKGVDPSCQQDARQLPDTPLCAAPAPDHQLRGACCAAAVEIRGGPRNMKVRSQWIAHQWKHVARSYRVLAGCVHAHCACWL